MYRVLALLPFVCNTLRRMPRARNFYLGYLPRDKTHASPGTRRAATSNSEEERRASSTLLPMLRLNAHVKESYDISIRDT